MLELNIGAAIHSQGREVARVERVILDRATYEATHLVVRHGNPLSPEYLLMPLAWVVGTEHDQVRIDRGDEAIAALPRFEVQHYIDLDKLEQEQARSPRSKIKPLDWVNYLVPMVTHALGDPYNAPGVIVTEQLLSPSESAVARGLPVESSDGHKLGEVHEVLLSEPDLRLSGIVMARGLFRKRLMRLPADWVSRITRDRIVLNRTQEQVETWESQKR
ncbi:MAG: PRC-barrel domain-containing protein [Blastocatellia bacterium]